MDDIKKGIEMYVRTTSWLLQLLLLNKLSAMFEALQINVSTRSISDRSQSSSIVFLNEKREKERKEEESGRYINCDS